MKKLTKGTVLLFAVLLTSMMFFSGCPTPFDLGDATKIDKELTVVAGGDISIDAFSSDVSVGVSPDDKVHLTYYEYERVTYEFMENEDGFSIEQEINGSNSGKIKDMTVLVPTGLILGAFSTETLSGDINITGVSANSVDVSAISGKIDINASSSIRTFSTHATSGDINITGVSANSVDVSATSGNMKLNQLSSNENVTLHATSGGIVLSKLSADGNININVYSANVDGSIVGSQGDFTVTSVVDDSRGKGTGTINPKTGGTGSKKLDLKTEQGDINITFTE